MFFHQGQRGLAQKKQRLRVHVKRDIPVFYAKLLFVFLGVSSVVLIKRSVFDVPVDVAAAAPVKLLALLSLVAWTAAITTGRLLAYL